MSLTAVLVEVLMLCSLFRICFAKMLYDLFIQLMGTLVYVSYIIHLFLPQTRQDPVRGALGVFHLPENLARLIKEGGSVYGYCKFGKDCVS